MKAIVRHAYGSSDVLRVHDIDKPPLKADGVIVRVHAASINHGDWLVTTDVPYLISTIKTHIIRAARRHIDLELW
jgi:NADPH:quinone reductase-like Zn-dependent oxidoreductase